MLGAQTILVADFQRLQRREAFPTVVGTRESSAVDDTCESGAATAHVIRHVILAPLQDGSQKRKCSRKWKSSGSNFETFSTIDSSDRTDKGTATDKDTSMDKEMATDKTCYC